MQRSIVAVCLHCNRFHQVRYIQKILKLCVDAPETRQGCSNMHFHHTIQMRIHDLCKGEGLKRDFADIEQWSRGFEKNLGLKIGVRWWRWWWGWGLAPGVS